MAATPAFPVSETVQSILENFSRISNQLVLAEGKKQKTVVHSNSVLAYAEFPEAWPKQTAIYDLSVFLGALSTFEKPAIAFDTKSMVITNDRPTQLRIKITYADPSTIGKVTDKVLPIDNPTLAFTLTNREIDSIKKTASLLKLTHVLVKMGGPAVTIVGDDPKKPNSHAFEIIVAPEHVTLNDPAYTRSLRLPVSHLGFLLDGDYTVLSSDWKYLYFQNKTAPVVYYLAEDTTK